MVPEIEKALSSQLTWRSVAEIPNCPALDFQDLARKVAAGHLFLAVNYESAHQLAHSIFGVWNSLVAGLLGWIPFLVALALLPAALILKNFLLLGGIPLALLAMVLSNPANPVKRFATLSGLLAAGAILWSWSNDNPAGAIIAASYAIPFWAIRYLYARTSRKLTREALRSEVLFLYLLEKGHAVIRDMGSGATFRGKTE